jgi:hypothetical protein
VGESDKEICSMRFALPEVSAIQMENAVEIYKLREKKHRLKYKNIKIKKDY